MGWHSGRREFSTAFKAAVVDAVKQEKLSLKMAGERFDILPSMVSRWCHEAGYQPAGRVDVVAADYNRVRRAPRLPVEHEGDYPVRRKCLCCGVPFFAPGRFLRVCGSCKTRGMWVSGA